MRKLLTLSIFALILSCTSENTTPNENSKEKVYEKLSYIVNDEKYSITIDITNEDDPIVIETDESKIIQSIFENEKSVFYYNPEIEDLVLFEDYNSYSTFINDKARVKSLKDKYKSDITPFQNTYQSKTNEGPVYGATPNVTVYKDSNKGGTSFSFLNSLSIYKNSNFSNTPVGDNTVSSIEVTNAYVGFWHGFDFSGYLLIIDSYNYNTVISNLRDAKLTSFTIYNGSSSSSYYCGWLCSKSWNDRISSVKARGDGIKNFNF
ncbi:hypothetical protein [Mariniflexile sp. HMF6888]|uniref:hypothetical protein n=1 Tax=Mariniflexile sp. HMF6888 TaxID=3373086 RepID=UPI0037B6A7B6